MRGRWERRGNRRAGEKNRSEERGRGGLGGKVRKSIV